jgi:hypothetical protein
MVCPSGIYIMHMPNTAVNGGTTEKDVIYSLMLSIFRLEC